MNEFDMMFGDVTGYTPALTAASGSRDTRYFQTVVQWCDFYPLRYGKPMVKPEENWDWIGIYIQISCD